MEQPTNADLKILIDKNSRALEKHAEHDASVQEYNLQFQREQLAATADVRKSLDEIKISLAPLSEAYGGAIFARKFVMGIAGVVIAIGAIGAGIIWVINAAVNKQ